MTLRVMGASVVSPESGAVLRRRRGVRLRRAHSFRTAQIALWIGLRHGGTTAYSLV
jgi:hypothetical protein